MREIVPFYYVHKCARRYLVFTRSLPYSRHQTGDTMSCLGYVRGVGMNASRRQLFLGDRMKQAIERSGGMFALILLAALVILAVGGGLLALAASNRTVRVAVIKAGVPANVQLTADMIEFKDMLVQDQKLVQPITALADQGPRIWTTHALEPGSLVTQSMLTDTPPPGHVFPGGEVLSQAIFQSHSILRRWARRSAKTIM